MGVLIWLIDVAAIAGASVVNHRYGGGSAWIDFFAVAFGFLILLAIGKNLTDASVKKFSKKQDAIDYLNSIS